MATYLHTTRYRRGKLPHWEVEHGRYFVTFRCADSLPAAVLGRLREVHEAARDILPQSEQYVAMQRRYFRTLEVHLDEGLGNCPLCEPLVAEIVRDELRALEEWHVRVSSFSIMPNHCHAMIEPDSSCRHGLGEILRRLKGRSARRINHHLNGSGVFWQREWFDRWMRTDSEYEKCVAYIRANPVKAGLAREIGEHPWTQ